MGLLQAGMSWRIAMQIETHYVKSCFHPKHPKQRLAAQQQLTEWQLLTKAPNLD
jgi:hypothetical protein